MKTTSCEEKGGGVQKSVLSSMQYPPKSPLIMGTGRRAFTLVELIIVITILAILATIAFMSFQGYMKQTRDAVRVSDLASASKGLSIFFTKSGVYPEAESPVTITASGNTLSSQGTLGESVVRAINMNQVPLDPVDQSKYTYSTNGTKTKYQLMSYTEGSDLVSYMPESYAGEYEEKGIKLVGDEIGIILNSDNSPITTGIDVFTTTGSYKAYVNKEITFQGTGVVLADLKDLDAYKKKLELKKTAKNYRVLIINQDYHKDPQTNADVTSRILENAYKSRGYEVLTDTGANTLEKVANYHPNFVVCDENYWECNSPTLQLLYNKGYNVVTIGNSTKSGSFIQTYTNLINKEMEGAIIPHPLSHFIARGWTFNYNNGTDGRTLITSLSANAVSIAQESNYNGHVIVYLEEPGKGRRIHYNLYTINSELFERANAYLLR